MWLESVRRSMFLRGLSAERARGSFPVTWTASVWKRALAAWAMAASSAMGWMTPVSLFANMMLTSLVLGRMAALRAAGSMRASGGGGRKVASAFRVASDSAAWRRAGWSVGVGRKGGGAGGELGGGEPERGGVGVSV